MTRLGLILMLVTACDGQPPAHSWEARADGANALFIYRDEPRGVTCYRVSMHDGVACLRDVPDGGCANAE